MIIMALDHVRDFYHADAALFQPDDLTRTTAVLFFTRWITHFCAPVFMFTAGMGAFFRLRGGRPTGELSVFLWKRGLWLVLLELTVLRFGFYFDFHSTPVIITVLWALGWSMVALGFLVRLPLRILAAFSVAMIALHNLADPVRAKQFGAAAWLWNILHQPGLFSVSGIPVVIGYPLVPWIGVMAAGFCSGQIMTLPAQQRRRQLLQLGSAITLAFVAIRALNVYGDPQRWSATLLSFLKVTKYPPSLDFLLMTLGPAILLLAWFDHVSFAETNPLMVFGRVPLFYFVLHFYLAHLLAVILGKTQHLWAVYLLWIAVVAMLYPVCLWYMRFKRTRKYWWLSYL
jgi:uncharacterized membrane protein